MDCGHGGTPLTGCVWESQNIEDIVTQSSQDEVFRESLPYAYEIYCQARV